MLFFYNELKGKYTCHPLAAIRAVDNRHHRGKPFTTEGLRWQLPNNNANYRYKQMAVVL